MNSLQILLPDLRIIINKRWYFLLFFRRHS